MDTEFTPMVATHIFKIEPVKYSNDWLVIRPGRARRREFEGSKERAIEKARNLLRQHGGGVIRVLNLTGKVAEEMQVSSEGEVVEQRIYGPRSKPSGEGAGTGVVLLSAVDEYEELHRVYIVLGEGMEVLAAIGENDGGAELEEAGFGSRAPVIELRVSMAELDKRQREWGPISVAGIERKARELCGERAMLLDNLAHDPKFQSCEETERKLAAALWVFWDRRRASHEVQTPEGRVARISRFLLLVDNQGCVTFEACPDAEAAAKVIRKLAAEQSPQAPDSLADRIGH
jgi:hypothetical protein